MLCRIMAVAPRYSVTPPRGRPLVGRLRRVHTSHPECRHGEDLQARGPVPGVCETQPTMGAPATQPM